MRDVAYDTVREMKLSRLTLERCSDPDSVSMEPLAGSILIPPRTSPTIH